MQAQTRVHIYYLGCKNYMLNSFYGEGGVIRHIALVMSTKRKSYTSSKNRTALNSTFEHLNWIATNQITSVELSFPPNNFRWQNTWVAKNSSLYQGEHSLLSTFLPFQWTFESAFHNFSWLWQALTLIAMALKDRLCCRFYYCIHA